MHFVLQMGGKIWDWWPQNALSVGQIFRPPPKKMQEYVNFVGLHLLQRKQLIIIILMLQIIMISLEQILM